MTIPQEYVHASRDFDQFVEDARQALDHVTRHQTYQTIESVFRIFRRRLGVADALAFADVLPPVLRAIFVADWNLDEPRRDFCSLEDMNREVHERRINHDFSPPDAIEKIACVLNDHVDSIQFDRALRLISMEACEFWNFND